jgi:type VI secretion system protein ImpK
MTTDSVLPLSALLRDTALEASLLAEDAVTTDVQKLRARCRQLIDEFASALEARKLSPDVARDALYMQCGLLDETALSHLPPDRRAQWEVQPLQVERFSKYDAGELVFNRLEERMREAPPDIELLECYATVLGLGFKGRFARDGETQRLAIVHALHDRLAKLAPSDNEELMVDATRSRALDWISRLSPWAIAALTCTAAALIFVLIAQNLDLQASHLLAAKS